MVSKNEWGNAIWDLFHTLIEKIKLENPSFIKEIFNYYKLICSIIPCPDCRYHSTKLLNQLNASKIINKITLQNLIFDFHNIINKKLKKRIYTKEILEIYKTKDLNQVLTTFFNNLRKKSSIKNEMMIFRNKNNVLNNFSNFLMNNKDKFSF